MVHSPRYYKLRVIMSFDRWICRTASLALVSALFVELICAEEGTTGPSAKPLQQFHNRIPAAEYDTRFAAAKVGFKDAEKLALTAHPAVGLQILNVNDGSPAYKLGIRTGDVATRINGTLLWSNGAFRDDSRRSLEFYSASSRKLKTVKLPEGKIGIDTTNYTYPDLTYLRSTSRNAKWDVEAYVGITSASTDPDLAETAWHRAFSKGYIADAYSAAAGVEIALTHGDAKAAAGFVSALRQYEGEREETLDPVMLYRAAVANGQLEEMLRVVQKYSYNIPISAAEIQALIQLRAKQQKIEGNPTALDEVADKYVRDNLIPRLVGHWIKDLNQYLPALQQRQPVTLISIQNHLDAMMVAPPEPSPNVDISFKLLWQPQAGETGSFRVNVALMDNSSPEFGYDRDIFNPILMGFSIDQAGPTANPRENKIASGRKLLGSRVLLEHSPMQQPLIYADPSMKLTAGTPVQFRLLKIGGTGELFVNGRRLLHVPLDDSLNQLLLLVRVLDTRVVIQDLTFDELVEDETKGTVPKP